MIFILYMRVLRTNYEERRIMQDKIIISEKIIKR